MLLGFACNWAPDAASTWSGTPWQLRAALRDQVAVVDLGIQVPALPRMALKAVFARRFERRLVSSWDHSAAWARWCAAVLPRRASRAGCDAVLKMGDLTPFPQPYFSYQDLSIDVVLRHYDDRAGGTPHFPGLSRDFLLRRRDRQLRFYDQAAGVLAMSHYLARTLVEWTGLPEEKVHVVHPGVSASVAGPDVVPRRDPPRRRLLFVGRDFHTKGGDVVVRALAEIRRTHDPEVTLSIAGPAVWPLPGEVPGGVNFLGPVPRDQVGDLYDDHDLLVMPSRLEGFGLVFVEALMRGLPCVARDAFAMPEVVRAGDNGLLVGGDDPGELAAAVVQALDDDGLYERCWAQREQVARYFTWARAAADTLRVVGGATG